MAALKYSRQRESIKEFLATRYDHPTADVVYENIRKVYPNISLGTVYRNLGLLASLGEIQKVTTGDGADHFDGNVMPHNHFICKSCGKLIDLDMDSIDYIQKVAGKNFDGHIEGHSTLFYGTCGDCTNKS
ncbi:MAG: transcriptional repressor [Lachnospiraceae bacterium]|nr:transcriptional repressor [Lachnospiraceae bacterium]